MLAGAPEGVEEPALERLPLYRLICLTWVPHWRGLPLPRATPLSTRWLLFLSLTLADVAALRYHLRPYRMLAPVQREQLLLKLLGHPRPLLARSALLWKSVALLTA